MAVVLTRSWVLRRRVKIHKLSIGDCSVFSCLTLICLGQLQGGEIQYGDTSRIGSHYHDLYFVVAYAFLPIHLLV